MKFLVFSDVHIGGKFNEAMFLKGVDIINKTEADYFIFTGDLTDQGTVAEYQLVKNKYLPMFEKEILLVPGNHDVKNVGDLLWEEY
ncbi:MAG: metallophosphoesterase, partial [Candidatus Heimdallarchaeota archaeon]|nr:metallophosphoesterase [Candidatus Heimdallarchaeota archaeon]